MKKILSILGLALVVGVSSFGQGTITITEDEVRNMVNNGYSSLWIGDDNGIFAAFAFPAVEGGGFNTDSTWIFNDLSGVGASTWDQTSGLFTPVTYTGTLNFWVQDLNGDNAFNAAIDTSGGDVVFHGVNQSGVFFSPVPVPEPGAPRMMYLGASMFLAFGFIRHRRLTVPSAGSLVPLASSPSLDGSFTRSVDGATNNPVK